jgi:hypothetical protein
MTFELNMQYGGKVFSKVTTLYVRIMSTQNGRILNLEKSKNFQDSQFGILIFFGHFEAILTSVTNYIIGRKSGKFFLLKFQL